MVFPRNILISSSPDQNLNLGPGIREGVVFEMILRWHGGNGRTTSVNGKKWLWRHGHQWFKQSRPLYQSCPPSLLLRHHLFPRLRPRPSRKRQSQVWKSRKCKVCSRVRKKIRIRRRSRVPWYGRIILNLFDCLQ